MSLGAKQTTQKNRTKPSWAHIHSKAGHGTAKFWGCHRSSPDAAIPSLGPVLPLQGGREPSAATGWTPSFRGLKPLERPTADLQAHPIHLPQNPEVTIDGPCGWWLEGTIGCHFSILFCVWPSLWPWKAGAGVSEWGKLVLPPGCVKDPVRGIAGLPGMTDVPLHAGLHLPWPLGTSPGKLLLPRQNNTWAAEPPRRGRACLFPARGQQRPRSPCCRRRAKIQCPHGLPGRAAGDTAHRARRMRARPNLQHAAGLDTRGRALGQTSSLKNAEWSNTHLISAIDILWLPRKTVWGRKLSAGRHVPKLRVLAWNEWFFWELKTAPLLCVQSGFIMIKYGISKTYIFIHDMIYTVYKNVI